ncbi:unnamed protein product [Symbiodinium necroappetens]|uniref:Uncharacterized protein n=1 Tax=Symbiodinium necroappetens TaxID=1628268 RepID=A0A813BBM2_9DINO|nr:unnamed protein product [Symbiodinium necroappetens]
MAISGKEEHEESDEAAQGRPEAGFKGANGIFIDYMSRNARSKHPMMRWLLADQASRQKMAQQVSKGEVGKKTLRSYKDARDLVNFERLEWNLMDLLTKFWKSKKHPLWVTPPDALQQIVRRIYMQHSMELAAQLSKPRK